MDLRAAETVQTADALGEALQHAGSVAQGADDAVADGRVVVGRSSLVSPRSGKYVRSGLDSRTVRSPTTARRHRLPALPTCSAVVAGGVESAWWHQLPESIRKAIR